MKEKYMKKIYRYIIVVVSGFLIISFVTNYLYRREAKLSLQEDYDYCNTILDEVVKKIIKRHTASAEAAGKRKVIDMQNWINSQQNPEDINVLLWYEENQRKVVIELPEPLSTKIIQLFKKIAYGKIIDLDYGAHSVDPRMFPPRYNAFYIFLRNNAQRRESPYGNEEPMAIYLASDSISWPYHKNIPFFSWKCMEQVEKGLRDHFWLSGDFIYTFDGNYNEIFEELKNFVSNRDRNAQSY